MKLSKLTYGLILVALFLPVAASAQVDLFGKLDTIYADVARVDDLNWTVTVSFTNDEVVEGLSVPLKLSAGANRIIADS